jgi:hypothetical protein
MDKMAINFKTSLKMGWDVGLVNELNAQEIFDKMVKELKQPTPGYFYADDVSKFLDNQLIELVQWADKNIAK